MSVNLKSAMKFSHSIKSMSFLFIIFMMNTTLRAQPFYTYSPTHAAAGQTFTMTFTGPANADTVIYCPVSISNTQGDQFLSTCVINGFATIIDSMHASVDWSIPSSAPSGSYDLFYGVAIYLSFPPPGHWIFVFQIDTNAFTIDAFTSTVNNISDKTINISQVIPNPFHNTAWLYSEKLSSETERLLIYNETGKKMIDEKFIDHQILLSKNELPVGVYYYQIINTIGHLQSRGKFIVN